MKKLFSAGILMLLTLLSYTAKAEINFDLSTVGGTLVMDYDAVNTERNKVQTDRWITVANFGASGTSGKCGTATKTFDIKSGRTIDFFLAKCDQLIITANVASGRSLKVNVDDGADIVLAGTGVCVDYTVNIYKEVPVKIRVQGGSSSSSWTSFFTFRYEEKTPKITGFKVNGIDAVINETAKTITKELPYGNVINNVIPEVTIGGTATSYSPTGAQDFSAGPVVFTATNGTTPVDYTATITVKATPDTEKAITSMTINGRTATINEETGIITCDFPSFEGPLGNWPVVFTLNATTASAGFTSGNSHDFGANSTLQITVTAQDNSTKVYTVSPTVSTKKNIGILAANGKAESYDNLLLSALSDYYVTFLAAPNTAPADIVAYTANYDALILHANVSGTNVTGLAFKNLVGVKPILNLKAFFYNSGRWSWSTTAPQNAVAGTASAEVETKYQAHPIFKNVTFSGTTLTYYDNITATNANAVQYASDLATLDKGTSYTIATVNTTGIQIHEIQDVAAAKFIMLGLSMENNNYNFFNTNTINILKNTIDYLVNPVIKFDHTFSTTGFNANLLPSAYYSKGIIYNSGLKTVDVYTVSGVKVLSSKENSISTESLPQGVYVIKTDDQKVGKFIR